MTTHVYVKRITNGDRAGRTYEIPCCPRHYDALIAEHGPDGGRP